MKNMKIENNKKNNNHIKAPVSLENTTEINIFSLFKWGKIGYYIEFNDTYITQKRYLGYNEAYNNFKVNLALFISLIFNCFKKEIFKICTFGNLVVVCCLRLFMIFFVNSYLINYIIHIRIFFCIILFILLIIICYIFCIGLIKREYMEYVTKRLVNNIGLWLTGLIVTYSLIGLYFVGVFLCNNYKELSSITLKYFIYIICYIWLFAYGIRHRGKIPHRWAVIPPYMFNIPTHEFTEPISLIIEPIDVPGYTRHISPFHATRTNYPTAYSVYAYEKALLRTVGVSWHKDVYCHNWADEIINTLDSRGTSRRLDYITQEMYNEFWTGWRLTVPEVNKLMELKAQLVIKLTPEVFVKTIIESGSVTEILAVTKPNEFYTFPDSNNPNRMVILCHEGPHPGVKMANTITAIINSDCRGYRTNPITFTHLKAIFYSVTFGEIKACLNDSELRFCEKTFHDNTNKFSKPINRNYNKFITTRNCIPDDLILIDKSKQWKNVNAFLIFKYDEALYRTT